MYASRLSAPPSLPYPDSFTPPNGEDAAACATSLTPIMPASSIAIAASARSRSLVNTYAAKPYGTAFA